MFGLKPHSVWTDFTSSAKLKLEMGHKSARHSHIPNIKLFPRVRAKKSVTNDTVV